MRADATMRARALGELDEIVVLAVGPAQVLTPESQTGFTREHTGVVTESRRIARLSLVELRIETAHESSESFVHDRRLRLSEPTISHTSSITQTLACT